MPLIFLDGSDRTPCILAFECYLGPPLSLISGATCGTKKGGGLQVVTKTLVYMYVYVCMYVCMSMPDGTN